MNLTFNVEQLRRAQQDVLRKYVRLLYVLVIRPACTIHRSLSLTDICKATITSAPKGNKAFATGPCTACLCQVISTGPATRGVGRFIHGCFSLGHSSLGCFGLGSFSYGHFGCLNLFISSSFRESVRIYSR